MLGRLRIPGLGGWGEDPLWATVYDWSVEHPQTGGLLWKIGIGSDLRRLYSAAAEIGRQPAGSSVLDVPVGGGVALRGLRTGQGIRYVAADISQAMLDRTMRVARERHVVAQVEPVLADVGSLPFADDEFDLVVSFTGLHCFPDPHLAVLEMARVLQPGGVLTGSALLTDTGLRYLPVRQAGRLAGLLGPGASSTDVQNWLAEAGFEDITLDLSGRSGTSAGGRGRAVGFPGRPGKLRGGRQCFARQPPESPARPIRFVRCGLRVKSGPSPTQVRTTRVGSPAEGEPPCPSPPAHRPSSPYVANRSCSRSSPLSLPTSWADCSPCRQV
ncbi:class I SAM-dependent methyltransferase [Marmoricola sp. URHB0036]|uniref:class I SAM-dependent methyltransferase n=1 Tax=Marmoricola sp. URHB0036 TaxID=1298863 RepID=UPI00041BB0A6|nr:class I SAM-dependent methyltransferase [Marmoricola sp. URHB0036]